MPDPLDVLLDPEIQTRTLTYARAVVQRRISNFAAEHVAYLIERDPSGYAETLVERMETQVLSESLPPQRITVPVNYEHAEAVGQEGQAVDARFERPIDHFTVKYRGRWWGHLLGLHRRTVRYEFVSVPYIITAPVSCSHRVEVDVRASWTYPKPINILPAQEWGPVVLQSGYPSSSSEPVTWRDQAADAASALNRLHHREAKKRGARP